MTAETRAILFGIETTPTVEFNPNVRRWFITIGNPGFNSPANNGFGFKTKGKALSVVRFFSNRGAK